jgi:hypothetical protein
MKAMVAISKLNRDETERNAFRADMAHLHEKENMGEEVSDEENDAILRKHGVEPQSHMFLSRKVRKTVIEVFMSVHLDEFLVVPAAVLGDKATVYVRFTPIELPKEGESQAGAAGRRRREPEEVQAAFTLRRHRYKWYITAVEGDFGKLKKTTTSPVGPAA